MFSHCAGQKENGRKKSVYFFSLDSCIHMLSQLRLAKQCSALNSALFCMQLAYL